MKTHFIAALAATLAPIAAFADDPTSREAAMTKLAAKLIYGESRCRDKYEFNVGMLEVLAAGYRMSMADWRPGGRFRRLLEADIDVLKAEHGSSSDQMLCMALEANFGMAGITVPGLMRPKK